MKRRDGIAEVGRMIAIIKLYSGKTPKRLTVPGVMYDMLCKELSTIDMRYLDGAQYSLGIRNLEIMGVRIEREELDLTGLAAWLPLKCKGCGKPPEPFSDWCLHCHGCAEEPEACPPTSPGFQKLAEKFNEAKGCRCPFINLAIVHRDDCPEKK